MDALNIESTPTTKHGTSRVSNLFPNIGLASTFCRLDLTEQLFGRWAFPSAKLCSNSRGPKAFGAVGYFHFSKGHKGLSAFRGPNSGSCFPDGFPAKPIKKGGILRNPVRLVVTHCRGYMGNPSLQPPNQSKPQIVEEADYSLAGPESPRIGSLSGQ